MEEGTFCRGEIREQLETESETIMNPEKMFHCKTFHNKTVQFKIEKHFLHWI